MNKDNDQLNGNIKQEITKIAQQFQNFECVPCVEAIKSYLIMRGMSGKVIKLFTGSSQGKFGNIYHEALGYNISTNGRHEAISVIIDGVELIFDNLHPQGINKNAWLSQFYCLAIDLGSGFEIIEIDFLEKSMEFYKLIGKIKQRPALYLGKPSLEHLQVFLDGYLFARRQLNISLTEEEKQFESFQEWIEEKFNQKNTQSWAKIILFYSQDEQTALSRFFELFDEFVDKYSSTLSCSSQYEEKVKTKT